MAQMNTKDGKLACVCGCKHFRIIAHCAGIVVIECVDCDKPVSQIEARQVGL